MKNRSLVPIFSLSMALLLSIAFSGVALADKEGKEPRLNPSKRGPEFRQRMLKRFDADGDGKLSDDERAAARKAMRRHREAQGSQGRGEGRKGGSGLIPERGPQRNFDRPLQNKEGSPSRGPRADQERRNGRNHRRHNSDKAPDPNKVFDRFDADGNGQLSREEFHKLTKTMRRMRDGHKGHRMGKGHGKRSGAPGEGGQRHGRRHDSTEGDSDRPRNRLPSRDRDNTSTEANPVQGDSL